VVATPDPFPRGITKLQRDMITGANGELLVDFTGYYESLAADFARAARSAGIDAELPHLNRSKHYDYRSYYNDYTRELVGTHFEPDVSMFGYTFDGRRTGQPGTGTRQ
jgi:hypothetical protein